MIEIIILLILLFLSSSVAAGVAYWKRRDLLGGDVDATCETDENCKTGLVCDPFNLTCKEPLGCQKNEDCSGTMICDETVFECVYAQVEDKPVEDNATVPEDIDCDGYWTTPACPVECGQEASTVTQTYNVTTEKQGNGMSCEATDGATRDHACAATEPCPVDCAGHWETQPCTVGCGENPQDRVEIYRVSVPRVGSGRVCTDTDGVTERRDGDERRTPYGCQPPAQGCNNILPQCVGEYEQKTCPANRVCNQPAYTIQRNYVVTTPGITCPNQGTTLPLTCPATPACITGDSLRPSGLKAKALYHGKTDKKVHFIRYKDNKKQCLAVHSGDDKIGENDTVGFENCDTIKFKDKMASWRLKSDGRIETWHTSHNHKKNNVLQPLCLDFNNSSSRSNGKLTGLKVTDCKDADVSKLNANELKNRVWNMQDHHTMTWEAQKNMITDTASYQQWRDTAPVRLQSQHSNSTGTKCIGFTDIAYCNRDDAQLYVTDTI
jgi:hypothetical protein